MDIYNANIGFIILWISVLLPSWFSLLLLQPVLKGYCVSSQTELFGSFETKLYGSLTIGPFGLLGSVRTELHDPFETELHGSLEAELQGSLET